MVVPYGDPGPMPRLEKNAFDAGEWGLGRMVNSLALGCDCLGVIHYFDAVFTSEQGKPYTIPNAICVHEEDYGMLWKAQRPGSGRTEVRRSRRLVVSSIATVGNYQYGFFWYFYLDGSIQFEVQDDRDPVDHGRGPERETTGSPTLIAPQLAAALPSAPLQHAHGHGGRRARQPVYEMEARARGTGADNPCRMPSSRWPPCCGPSRRPGASSTPAGADAGRWSTTALSTVGRARSPTSSCPGLDPDPLGRPRDSSVGRRRRLHHPQPLVTPFASDESAPGGDYPKTKHSGGDGLPRWTAADVPSSRPGHRPVVHLRATHIRDPRTGPSCRWRYTGFSLAPVGFLSPQSRPRRATSPSAACHTE